MRAAGFVIVGSEGIVLPLPFIFGNTALARWLLRLNSVFAKLRPALFGFQILLRARARPSLATLLDSAQKAALEKAERDQLQTKERAA
jgi:hypothetical protein